MSVKHDSLRYIRSHLRRAWAYHLHRQICHRKGAPDFPFDYDVLSRVLRTMSTTAIRQVAYNLTGGYQVAAVKAMWTSTVSDCCPFCDHLDTHAHQQLDCPAFLEVRQRHPQAIAHLRSNPQKLWLPLPISFPDISTLRQLLACRGQDTDCTKICQEANVLYFYTDGSADTPLHPETRRAAWSVVQFRPQSESAPYLTIKIQHLQGPQSIARAELAAVTWVVTYAAEQQWQQHIVITTDSQYVINLIQQVTHTTCSPMWYRLAHADLLQQLAAQGAFAPRPIVHATRTGA